MIFRKLCSAEFTLKSERRNSLYVAVLFSAASASWAQPVGPGTAIAPNPAPSAVFEGLRAPVELVPRSSDLQIEDSITRRKLAAPASGQGPKFAVTGFTVTGLSVPIKADLGLLLGKYVGADRTFDQLEEAAEALQNAIRQEGLFLAQVDIPPQKLEGGKVELRVLEGRLDKWELAPLPEGVLVSQAQIEAVLGGLQPGMLLQVDAIERVLFLLYDLRGLIVKSVIEAGSKPGTAKLVVSVEPGQRLEKSVDFDNFGSIYTGEYRLSGAISVNSPMRRGDFFKLSGNVSTNGGLAFVRAAYQSPVGGSGLKLGAAVSALNYKLGTPTFAAAQGSGTATVYSLFALYPVVRNRNFNAFAQANYDRRNFEDKSFGFTRNKHSDVLNLGLVGDSRDQALGGGINNFSIGVSVGRLALEGAQDLINDQALRKTNGTFGKVSYGIGRQNLLWNSADNAQDRLVLYASWQGQRASKNLDTSEKFGLGGASGVRGYASGEGTGDSGDLVTWELRKNIISDKIQGDLVVALFGDYGHVTVNRNNSSPVISAKNSISMSSHGIGLTWAVPDNFLFKVSLARRGSYLPVSDPDPRRTRLYLSLSKTL